MAASKRRTDYAAALHDFRQCRLRQCYHLGGAWDVFEGTVTLENCILSGNTSRGTPQDLSLENATLNRVGRNIVGQRDIFATVTETGPDSLSRSIPSWPPSVITVATRTLALKRNSPARHVLRQPIVHGPAWFPQDWRA